MEPIEYVIKGTPVRHNKFKKKTLLEHRSTYIKRFMSGARMLFKDLYLRSRDQFTFERSLEDTVNSCEAYNIETYSYRKTQRVWCNNRPIDLYSIEDNVQNTIFKIPVKSFNTQRTNYTTCKSLPKYIKDFKQ